MENAYQEVLSQIPDGADDYTKVMTVYTYVIDLSLIHISSVLISRRDVLHIVWHRRQSVDLRRNW